MAYIRCGGGGIPATIKTDMNSVLNKKFGTSTDYPPTEWANTVNLMGALPVKTASGSIAHFEDGADTVPLKSSKFYITPTQASGTPTPSNPLPISGHTGLTVTRTGANLFTTEGETESSYINTYGETQNSTGWKCSGFIPVPHSTQMHFNPTTTSESSAKHAYYDASKNFISYINSGEQTFTTPDNCVYMRFSYRTSSTDIQLEVGNTATAYAPYTATAYPVSWSEQGTVYGGYFKDGELWKTHEGVEITSVVSVSTASTGAKYGSLSGLTPTATSERMGNSICSNYVQVTSAPSPANTNKYRLFGGSIYIFDERFTDKTTADSILAVEKPFFVYELATPVKVADLEEVEINSLLGVNNIWCDTGDSEVEYRADIDLLISEMGG